MPTVRPGPRSVAPDHGSTGGPAIPSQPHAPDERPSPRLLPGAWSLAGIGTGVAGLATSYATARLLAIRESPVVAIAEGVIDLTPGVVVERAISLLGAADKPVLIGGVIVGFLLLAAWAGRLARRSAWAPLLVWLPLALLTGLAVWTRPTAAPADLLPVAVGFATWVVMLPLLADRMSAVEEARASGDEDAAGRTRRAMLIGAGVAAVGTAVVAAGGVFVGRARSRVEASRQLLRLPGVRQPDVPAAASIGLAGVSPWATSADRFYVIHTALAVPTIEPDRWRLRIHGMVDREVTLSFDDLLARRRTEAWITLNCVSNEVGGDLIGNAWWSGVRLRDILEEVGVSPDADCVRQVSEDGWDCATPLSALTDPDRDAMLAIAMNGHALPIEHGFPVRTIVPGLYGYVSATKWVVDMEVTRYSDVSTFWTQRGWAEQGPVKIASRVDVPRGGAEVPSGEVRVGGVAWAQHTGIEAVEVALDGGAWVPAELAGVPSTDTWVQWAATITCPPGDHEVRVRATGRDGEVQTGVVRGVLPDGSTGWHGVEFSAV